MYGVVRGHRYQARRGLRLPLDLLAQASGSEEEEAVADPLQVGPVGAPNKLANGFRVVADQRVESRGGALDPEGHRGR